MKLRSSALAFGGLALVAVLVGAPILGAGDPKAPPSPQPIAGGFTKEFVLIQTKDGGFTVLKKPHVRKLAEKAYLVGETVSLPLNGLADETCNWLFRSTIQWICLEDVRRIGEADDEDTLTLNSHILSDRQHEREERARAKK